MSTTNGKEEKNPVSMGWVRGVGQEFRDRELRACIQQAGESGFEFMTHFIGGEGRAHWNPAANPALKVTDLPPISTVDLQMTSSDWSRWVVGRLSPWIDLDNEDERIRELSTAAFGQEMEYIKYLGLSAILIQLTGPNNQNLARELGVRLWTKPGFLTQCWVVVPTSGGEDGGRGEGEDTWEWWHQFRSQLGSHRRLGICLRLTPNLPGSEESREKIVKRWLGEPIASVFLDTTLFTSNKAGSPILPAAHKHFLLQMFRLQCQVVLEGSRTQTCPQLKPYVKHVNVVWLDKQPLDSISEWSRGYEDHLQVPLQPLSDNLESSTYEVFEKDPVKYKLYQEAMTAALGDIDAKSPSNPREPIVLMVLGAGRGPLVTAALQAVAEVGLGGRVKVYAVEKNPNSAVTLKYLRDTLWNHKVEVVETDMRHFHPEQKADLIVSELLGSFGDNELSPECLDGALHVMKPSCISIPSKYTSYMAPVHSPRLFASIRDEFASHSVVVTGKGVSNGSRPSVAVTENLTADGVSDVFDLPYVVRLQNHYQIAEPLEVFEFNHPNWEKKSNERRATLKFKASLGCELMGFAGYFDTVLYGDIKLSINPQDHTEGMFSWFPALFPIARPVRVKADDEIVMDIWRIVGKDKAWYEWVLRSPEQLRVQNTGGMGHSMALF